MPTHLDCVIIGAGAAGLFCGGLVAQTGRSVAVLEHSRKPAEKVRISGGGRCNFTNIHTSADNFISTNPHFSKSALSRYTPTDFCKLMRQYGLSWTEKTLGQLFCDQKSTAIIAMLLTELEKPGGSLRLNTNVSQIESNGAGFAVHTPDAVLTASKLVIATGGLSIPKIGASGFAYDLAKQFGHRIITPRPALVPLTFSGNLKDDFSALSGVSTPARVRAGSAEFEEALLFTHRGLSGPSILQASSYWHEGEDIRVNLMPGADLLPALKTARQTSAKRSLANVLADHLPKRLIDRLAVQLDIQTEARMADLSNETLERTCTALSDWHLKPAGTEGWRTAEVTAGGIAPDAISSKSMESQHQSDLYFIGECLDVTGWLGGYNFQWAWASAAAAAEHITSTG